MEIVLKELEVLFFNPNPVELSTQKSRKKRREMPARL